VGIGVELRHNAFDEVAWKEKGEGGGGEGEGRRDFYAA